MKRNLTILLIIALLTAIFTACKTEDKQESAPPVEVYTSEG